MFADDLKSFLYSDVSGAAIDVLTTPFKLWWLNTIAHFAMGSALMMWALIRPRDVLAIWLCVACFTLLQVIQTFNTDRTALVLLDGIFDVLVLAVGSVVALWAASSPEVRK